MRLWLSLTVLVVLACVVAEISAAKSKREVDSAKKGHSEEIRYSKSKSDYKNKGKNKENFAAHEKKKRSNHVQFVADGRSKKQRRESVGQEAREEVVKVKSYKSPKADKHAEKHADKHTNKHAEKHTNKHAEKYAEKHAEKHADEYAEKLQAEERIVDKETKPASKRNKRSEVVEATRSSVADSNTVEERLQNDFARSDEKSDEKRGKQNVKNEEPKRSKKIRKQSSDVSPNLSEQVSNGRVLGKLEESEKLDDEKKVLGGVESFVEESKDRATLEQGEKVEDARKTKKKRSSQKKCKYSAEKNEEREKKETEEEKLVDAEPIVGMKNVADEKCVGSEIRARDHCPVE